MNPNESSTPETEAALIKCGWDTTHPVVKADFARTLERQRDAALAHVTLCREAIISAMANCATIPDKELTQMSAALSATA